MRLATYSSDSAHRSETVGLVISHPHDGTDWVFSPLAIEAMLGTRRVKGAGSPWARTRFLNGDWPNKLVDLVADDGALDACRRLSDYLARFMEQGDPVAVRAAGTPIDQVTLLAPVPRPPILLGVVGNNAAFLRSDGTRGHNLHLPACHARPQTTVIGSGQPVVIPSHAGDLYGTVELGVIIGRAGKDVPRDRAWDYVAGYTIVNDWYTSSYVRRWAELDEAAGIDQSRFHFHSVNTASWLAKSGDTMCSVGPYLVTLDDVGDPYDLMCAYREGGQVRARAHSSTLVYGIEEMIEWLSRFVTLQPGMILHLGAMGQDGIPAQLAGVAETATETPSDYAVEAEIEAVGCLTTPLRREAADDPAEPDSRFVVPIVDHLTRSGAAMLTPDTWTVSNTRHFWTLLANTDAAAQSEGAEPRPYPLAYHNPASTLAASGATVTLPQISRDLTLTCELGVVIGSLARRVTPDEARQHILGYVVLAVLRDSSFQDSLVKPHVLSANIPALYNRWPDGFNVCSLRPTLPEDPADLAMRVTAEGSGATLGEAVASTGDYGMTAPYVIAELSRDISLLPGDVISLGGTGASIALPYRDVPYNGLAIRATIEYVGEASAILADHRQPTPRPPMGATTGRGNEPPTLPDSPG